MKTYISLLIIFLLSVSIYAQNISKLEYFYDTDPGLGNGTALSVNSNSGSLTQTFSLPVPANATGFHRLYIRGKSNSGQWGLYKAIPLYVYNPNPPIQKSIAKLEYFYDTDPGLGNGTALFVNSNSGSLTQTFSLPVLANATGFHKLYIRGKSGSGQWGLYKAISFYILTPEELNTEASPIAGGEFYENTEPGQGNGIQTDWTPPQQSANTHYMNLDLDKTARTGEGNYMVDLSTQNLSCGKHNIYFRLKNQKGKWSHYGKMVEVNIYDNAPPTIVPKNISVTLDNNNQATITAAQVSEGTYDDCELVSVEIDKTTFNCSNVGENTVKITATDAKGKVSTANAIVTVVDTVAPVVLAKDITVALDTSGQATISPNEVDNGTSDNCSFELSLDTTSFSCANIGENTVTLTATDGSNNTSTATAKVTVVDNLPPQITTKDITVTLSQEGTVSITPEEVLENSSDNCTSNLTYSLDVDTFNEEGTYTVTLTAKDNSENVATETAQVTVKTGMGIEEVSLNKIKVYPNPVKGILYVKHDLPIQKLILYDVSGKLVKTVKNRNQLDVREIKVGTYLLKVFSEEKVFTEKIIIK